MTRGTSVELGAFFQERFARKNEAAELHRAFNTLDRNHDGVIDADELNALFLDMGHKAKKVSYQCGMLHQLLPSFCAPGWKLWVRVT